MGSPSTWNSTESMRESPVMVSVGEDGCVVMYDTAERAIVRSSKVVQGKLYSVCILDHQHLAVAGSDNMIRIVDK